MINGLRWEQRRRKQLAVAEANKKAQALRTKAQVKLNVNPAPADCSEWLPFLRSLTVEPSVRAVCRYVHFVTHRADDKAALGLAKNASGADRLAAICAHTQQTMQAAVQPVLNARTRVWELPAFVPFVLAE